MIDSKKDVHKCSTFNLAFQTDCGCTKPERVRLADVSLFPLHTSHCNVSADLLAPLLSSLSPRELNLLEELELAQQRLHKFFGARLQGQAGRDVLWLLNPELVGHASLRQTLSESGEGRLIGSLERHANVSIVTLSSHVRERMAICS